MQLPFLKVKVYKRRFLLYTSVLFVLCVMFGYILLRNSISNKITEYQSQSTRAFDQVEDRLTRNSEEIEKFIIRIYSSKDLLEDMLLFMGSNSEDYETERLNRSLGSKKPLSFVDSLREFIGPGTNSIFSRISIHEGTRANIFLTQNSEVLFRRLNTDPIFQDVKNSGIMYQRVLETSAYHPGNMGELQFVFKDEYVFSHLEDLGFPYVVVTDDSGIIRFSNHDMDRSAYPDLQAYHGQGVYWQGFRPYYYSIHTSGHFGYRMESSFDLIWVIGQNNTFFFMSVFGILAIFALVMIMIASNMNQEAEFLSRIIQFIGSAKSGHFQPISRMSDDKNKNEYGIIAAELNDMATKLEHLIQREYILKLEQKETEMRALEHQINPHFLYNTLEIIRSRASVNQEHSVADAIHSLGTMYRKIVKNDSVITLEEEMKILNSYLEIMEFRYNGNFCYSTKLDPSMKNLMTVKFWMQPVAENFFIHGYDKSSEYNLFILAGWEEEDAFLIEMMNNGNKMSSDKLVELNASLMQGTGSGSIGLRNVYTRLKFFYGDAFSMEIRNNEEAGITVSIHIKKEGIDAV